MSHKRATDKPELDSYDRCKPLLWVIVFGIYGNISDA
jgi:hypothetical protein